MGGELDDIRKFTNADWARLRVKCLDLAIKRGMVKAVANSLADQKRIGQIMSYGGCEELEALGRARRWLQTALAYEAVHGKDSLLDRSDPFVRDKLIPGWETIKRRDKASSNFEIG